MQDIYEKIKQDCLSANEKDPIQLFLEIARKEYVSIHGPEHHVLDGACLLTALKNAGVNFDLKKALDTLEMRGKQMPGAICGQWGVCGSAASVGAALAILHETGPLSQNSYYKDNLNLVAQCLTKIAEVGGPRCCKRNAFLSLQTAVAFVKAQYGISLPQTRPACVFSDKNLQCLQQQCPFFKGGKNA